MPLNGDFGEAARFAIRQLRRVAVLIVGTAVLLAGLLMLVGPGPGFIVVFAGLAILATEFLWARRLLRRMREKGLQMTKALLGKDCSSTGSDSPSRSPRVIPGDDG
jgi:tellurite resistance protein TerC